jgi:uncharacterized protein
MNAPRKAASIPAILGLCALGLLSGCGHAARTEQARSALDKGAPDQALRLYNEELRVKSEKDFPSPLQKDDALLVLDRSLIQQQLSQFELSSRDLEFADKQIQLLDFGKTAMEDIGKYMFSDDTGGYRAPPYEKLLINTMNMVNYLARHDLSGAKVEARRLAIMQKYFRDNKTPGAGMLAPGSYIAGFVFEQAGRPDIAIRYYDEALSQTLFSSLEEPVARLVATTGYRGEFTAKLLKQAPPAEAEQAGVDPEHLEGASATEGTAEAEGEGELLVLVAYGRAPAKIARRIPIGAALTLAAMHMSSLQTSQANEIAARGLVTWVNFPDLEETPRTYELPVIRVDGQAQTPEILLDVGAEAREAFSEDRGRIIASAITRLVTRAIVGEAAGAAAGAAAGDRGIGALVTLATEASLTAADTPDTRSWSTLPGQIATVRLRVPAGPHKVEIQSRGSARTSTVSVKPGRWEAVTMTVLR